MTTEANQDRLIKQAIADAERMIYFASQGKMDDQVDLLCLKNLAKATFKIKNSIKNGVINENDVSHFYSQLSIMAHILYPVTAESLMVMEAINLDSCMKETGNCTLWASVKHIKTAACSSPMLMLLMLLVFFIGVIATPYVFTYSMEGSNLIGRLDGALKDRISVKKEQLEEEREKGSDVKPDSPQKPASGDGQSGTNTPSATSSSGNIDAQKGHSDRQRPDVKAAIIRSLRWLGQVIVHANALTSFEDDQGEKEATSKENLQTQETKDQPMKQGLRDTVEARTLVIEKRIKIKTTGLLILQGINGTLLLLLFGFCGATTFILRKTIQSLQAHTFTGIRCTTWIRILLGTFCGFFLGYLGGNDDLLKMLTFENEVANSTPIDMSLVSPLTLAFIGGYSVDLLFSILNRFIYAVTSDERYLPTSEIVRRKVDVSKFIEKEPKQP
jgi:hypothetical protein